MKSIVILTGAGISAEAGIRTFRASDGLWENHRIEDVATPEAFNRNPDLVHQFYNSRRKQLLEAELKPTIAHKALVELEQKWKGDFLIVTQNVDNLHSRAGSKKLLHMHGELQKIFCAFCTKKSEWFHDLSRTEACTHCHFEGRLRPDIVWFGEMPYHLDAIYERLDDCDIFISIGTSGNVYPAAGFADHTTAERKIEVNIAGTEISNRFTEHRIGPASLEVKKLVDELLS